MASTIPAAKQAFLGTQTTLLAQPLAPSRAWVAANRAANDDALPDGRVADALFHANHAVQQHCRRVYAPQATRHIAEQINHVYAQDAERRIGGEHDVEGGIGRELDLTSQTTIDDLPATWPSDGHVEAFPLEARRYADTVQRLASLNAQRRELRARVARLARLKAVVEPLQTRRADDQDDGVVQHNLVTRNGALETELERMRFLLARVGGRVHALPDHGEEQPQMVPADAQGARKRRVDEFLAQGGVFPP